MRLFNRYHIRPISIITPFRDPALKYLSSETGSGGEGEMNDQPLNFDDWKALAKSDPDAFEVRRKQVIEQFISSVPPERQQRLRRLQWRIDMERRRCSNPVKSCLRLYTMMWDSVYGDNGLLEALQHGLSDTHLTKDKRSANILSFKRNLNVN